MLHHELFLVAAVRRCHGRCWSDRGSAHTANADERVAYISIAEILIDDTSIQKEDRESSEL